MKLVLLMFRMYRDCPTDPERMLDYFNNYNGGIVNQVQPSVDNEVTPLVTKIGNVKPYLLMDNYLNLAF